jgi:hypothetical protein
MCLVPIDNGGPMEASVVVGEHFAKEWLTMHCELL